MVLQTRMLSKTALLEMANAEGFEAAVDLLTASEYGLTQRSKTLAEMENVLQLKRTQLRDLFKDLILDEAIIQLFRAREDFANLRLALRRKLTERPLGTDYNHDGSIPAEEFEQIFEEEKYSILPMYLQEAIEQAVLAYYQNKDVRQIDYALDKMHAGYRIKKAQELNNIFLLGFFRIMIDLTNIRTMLRLKFTDSEQRDVFLDDGYIEPDRLKRGLDIGYDAVAQLFFATAYYELVESSVGYLTSNKSFLKTEYNCQEHLMEFLRTTSQITAGAQPIIAYLLMKENEIRMVRLILTAKKNHVDTRLILDRIS
jgi:V/A-type H+-transporting ATPase subunit C